LSLNFSPDYDYTEERFYFDVLVMDQFTQKHILPLYLSKVTNPDQAMIKFDENGQPLRGVRTFAEVAHYVRCIPYQNRDNIALADSNLWCSPDFTATIKVGTEEDHALLMASIFRTVKHEDQLEFNKWAKEEKSKTKTRGDKDKELLTVNVPGGGAEEKEEEEETKDETKKETTEGKTEEKKEGEPEEKVDTVDDRVFVCIGKTMDVIERKALWVMTINRTFDTVTFWEAKNHKHYVLKYRIDPGEEPYLEAYLSPNLS
jgi:hypothetical protein